MNFLAHLYLSGPAGDILTGNFIADSVRAVTEQEFSTGIRKGIALHRHIDSFTDHHPIVLQSKERLRSRYHKYAPVITDVFYDHFLASHWATYYPASDLETYAREIYAFLGTQVTLFPTRSRQFYEYMVRTNALCRYAEIEGVSRVMQGMSRRARFRSGMETCTEELRLYYPQFEEEFRVFFPELIASCQKLMQLTTN
ncbi:MAG TPA: ACP phosphodiesterase [Bacteroidia bacterium]|nr:ACP phosphodiesterase [Bacteroidia bacterium]